LESFDLNIKQAIYGIERAQRITKNQLRSMYTPQIENGFETVLSKIRKGNLSKEERL
jgi:hypothetical protein